MIRQIIHIDEEKCNGCGICANACHEGAILSKYSPEHVEKGLNYIEGAIHKIYVLKLEIREATGKARKK